MTEATLRRVIREELRRALSVASLPEAKTSAREKGSQCQSKGENTPTDHTPTVNNGESSLSTRVAIELRNRLRAKAKRKLQSTNIAP